MAKPAAIATIIPATAGTKYVSDTEANGASVGVGVGAAGSTVKAVTACDGQ
jgi:dissimilatory sulfite reductase (desulfoviridin) alpha/beta subunit